MTGEKSPIRWRDHFKIPKTFTIYDANGEQVSQISKEILTLLPRFEIQLRDGSSFVIRKKLTFWRDKYEFDNLGLRIEGNIWDLNFKLLDDRDQLIAGNQERTLPFDLYLYRNGSGGRLCRPSHFPLCRD